MNTTKFAIVAGVCLAAFLGWCDAVSKRPQAEVDVAQVNEWVKTEVEQIYKIRSVLERQCVATWELTHTYIEDNKMHAGYATSEVRSNCTQEVEREQPYRDFATWQKDKKAGKF